MVFLHSSERDFDLHLGVWLILDSSTIHQHSGCDFHGDLNSLPLDGSNSCTIRCGQSLFTIHSSRNGDKLDTGRQRTGVHTYAFSTNARTQEMRRRSFHTSCDRACAPGLGTPTVLFACPGSPKRITQPIDITMPLSLSHQRMPHKSPALSVRGLSRFHFQAPRAQRDVQKIGAGRQSKPHLTGGALCDVRGCS